ncbi:MAG: cytochrome c [Betaproteobacteria bacterium]|nr:cytochrome c [Betaproteobacteria bacterium]
MRKIATRLIACTLTVAAFSAPLAHAGDKAEDAMKMVQEKYGVDVKKVFGTQCGLCHGKYGMEMGGRGGGPKLADTKMNEAQLTDRISNGKTGMMPSFKKMLKENELQGMVAYIMAIAAK